MASIFEFYRIKRARSKSHSDGRYRQVLCANSFTSLAELSLHRAGKPALNYLVAEGRERVKGGETTVEYDLLGRIIAITDPMGAATAYSYDANGNLLSVTDALGNVTAYEYDALNRVTAEIAPNGGKIVYAYDCVGNLIETTDALGHTTTYSYDAAGNIIGETDAEGNAKQYQYDKANRLIAVVDELGGKTSYAYDAMDHIVQVTDALRHATKYTYDKDGNLTSETDALGHRVQYAYTPEGWLSSVTKADGAVMTFEYDKTGALTRQNVGDGQSVTSSYNEIGKLTEVSSEAGTIRYQYNEQGFLISVENVNGDVVSYTYDAYGNKTSMTYPDSRTVSYTYDAMNRMVGVVGLDGETTSYVYDAAGRRIQTVSGNMTTRYAYDSVGNLTEQATSGASDIAFRYSYDRNGYITGEKRTENGTETENSYAYNALGELTSFLQSTGYGESYVYDKAGNMLEKAITGTDGQNVTLKMAYNAANQLTGMTNGQSKIAYSYDKNGSLIQKTLTSKTYGKLTDRYAHDALDQLTSYVGYDGYQQQFTYDANGMRLSKKETGDTSRSTLEELLRGNIAGLPEIVVQQAQDDAADVPEELAWATTDYLYDITQEYYQVISETRTETNGHTATTAYAYGLERIAAYTADGKTRYVYDGRGSVVQTISAPVAGAAVSSALPDISVKVQSFAYTAFGEQMGVQKVSGFAYNAEAYDAATGMLNLRARQYEPALNRFSQKDIYPPNLLITYSFNAYLFTFNSPISFVDADGLQASSLRNVLSSIGNTVKKAASAIGNGIKKVASALVGETVVNTVISKVKSVAKAVKNVVKPVVDVATSAWQKAKECLAEAQEEIRALEETRPVSEAEKNEIIRRACAKFLGLDDTTSSASIQTTEQMYTVEGGMVLHTTKNPYGRIVLPPGTYTQAEIVSFIMEYGDSVMIRDVMDLIAKGSATATFPDGSTVTITAQEGLQNLINANREQATLEAWEPSFWQQAGMVVGQAFDQAIKGDYAEETTPVGTLAQIGVGFIPVADTITDIRDFTYSAQQFWYKPSWGNAGWVAVDLIGFIPVLGSLKPVFKHGDEFIDATGTVIKNVDNMVDATGTVIRKADDVADVATDIAKHGDDFVQSLPSSKKLRRNLELAGVEVPDYPNAAHHIVAGSAPGAENAREILTKFGIDINDSSNGVFLPTQRNVVNSAYHPSLHSTEYYEKVDDMLSAATNREEAIEILHEIADQLAEGTFFN